VRERLEQFRDLVVNPQSSGQDFANRAAADVGAMIWGPFADLLPATRRVIVSPGGLAEGVPWALLRVPGDPGPALERFEFSSAPSLQALAIARAGPVAGATGPLLVLTGSGDERGRTLPGVKSESKWLESRYAPVILSAPRTRSEVARSLVSQPRFGCVHVAAHFADDPENPWRTGVLLGDPQRDDAYLRPRDLDSTRVRARLVVLAGCASASAHTVGLEADRGLASAFLASGANAVVGTLWPVGDEASAEFTKRFYRALESGGGAAGALAEAQRQLRKEGSDASNWAGFVVLGDPQAVPALRRR
jgi:CHAT domain-containing protein